MPSCLIAAVLAAALVLNELMIRPHSGESEWVEILNRGDTAAPLAGLTFEDARGRPSPLPDGVRPLEPGGFVVLAANPQKLGAYAPLDSARVLKLAGSWPTLNDSDGSAGFADAAVLRNSDGAILDSVAYFTRWLGERGVSIERVDPGGPSLLPANWSPSADAAGATPLLPNSLALSESERDQGALILPRSPVLFDAPGASAAIGWKIDHPSALSIELFDLAGAPVRLLKPLDESGTVGRVAWDGTDDAGRPVPTGIYLVVMEGRAAHEIRPGRWRRALVLIREQP